jgi:segregation and condensation protein B
VSDQHPEHAEPQESPAPTDEPMPRGDIPEPGEPRDQDDDVDEAETPAHPEPPAAEVEPVDPAHPEAPEPPDPEGEPLDPTPSTDAPEPVADVPDSVPDSVPDDVPTSEPPADEGVEDGLPPLSDADLESALEALLLVVDSPTEEEALATALDTTPLRVAEHLRLLSDRYTDQDRGIDLRRAGGGWRLYTRDRYAPYVEKLLLDGQRAKLTRAALETLAVIAYRQPVTRARVAAVRGVNCDGVIRTLLARGLVEETGTDAETGGFLYRTTELFLERLGLSSLEDLPPIAPLLPEVDSIDEL